MISHNHHNFPHEMRVSWRARRDSNSRPLGSKDSGLLRENTENYSGFVYILCGKLTQDDAMKYRENMRSAGGFPTPTGGEMSELTTDSYGNTTMLVRLFDMNLWNMHPNEYANVQVGRLRGAATELTRLRAIEAAAKAYVRCMDSPCGIDGELEDIEALKRLRLALGES